VVVGDSPLAVALAALAPRVGLPVTVVAQGADAARFADAERVITVDDAAEVAAQLAPGAFVVVATQGRRDLQALRAALGIGARQLFFVASVRKAAVLKAALLEAGHDAAAVDAIVAPAGEPIGAQTPEEIALAVLATVVAARRGAVPAQAPAAAPVPVAPVVPVVPVVSKAATATRAQPVALDALPDLPPIKGSCCGG
jgi:xanthine dehydrogenase accessory factor